MKARANIINLIVAKSRTALLFFVLTKYGYERPGISIL